MFNGILSTAVSLKNDETVDSYRTRSNGHIYGWMFP